MYRPKRKDGVSRIWWISYTDEGGIRRRVSSGTDDKAKALAMEAALRADAREREKFENNRRATVGLMAELYLAHLSKKGKKKTTLERAQNSLAPFVAEFGNRKISDIGREEMARYVDLRQERVQESTVGTELRCVSAALGFVNDRLGWNVPRIVKGLIPSARPSHVRCLTRDEYDRLLMVSRHRPMLRAFIILAVNTGLRSGELHGLRWENVHLDDRIAYLDAESSKGGRQDSVVLNSKAIAALESIIEMKRPGSYVFSHPTGECIKSLSKSFRTACRRAHIQRMRVHDLRHTCAAWLLSSGASLREVSEVLRHKSIVTTMVYAHLAPEARANAVNRL